MRKGHSGRFAAFSRGELKGVHQAASRVIDIDSLHLGIPDDGPRRQDPRRPSGRWLVRNLGYRKRSRWRFSAVHIGAARAYRPHCRSTPETAPEWKWRRLRTADGGTTPGPATADIFLPVGWERTRVRVLNSSGRVYQVGVGLTP